MIHEVSFQNEIVPLLHKANQKFNWLNGPKHYRKPQNLIGIYPNEHVEGWTFFSLFQQVYHVKLGKDSFRKVGGSEILLFDFDGQGNQINCAPVNAEDIIASLAIGYTEPTPAPVYQKETPVIMHPATERNEFTEDMMEEAFAFIRAVFRKKNKEYGKKDNPFHNFDAAGSLLKETSEKALMGMWVKHIVSIVDLVDAFDKENKIPSIETLWEKCGDSMIYNFLLIKMFERTIQAHQQYKKAA